MEWRTMERSAPTPLGGMEQSQGLAIRGSRGHGSCDIYHVVKGVKGGSNSRLV
jgi:hypothetical protein